MSGKASQRHRLLKLLALLLFAFALWFGWTCLWVVRESRQQEVQPADAIVVFGAAEYSGRPSPVLRARLDHAFNLFQLHASPVVITTGGAGDDPKYTEGGVGRDYLMHRGIPEASLIAETLGSDTAQSAERVGVIMRANHMRRCSPHSYLTYIRYWHLINNGQHYLITEPSDRSEERIGRVGRLE